MTALQQGLGLQREILWRQIPVQEGDEGSVFHAGGDSLHSNVRNGGKADIGISPVRLYSLAVARTQQTFENGKDGPVYVSVEPWPHAFELEPGDKLTLIWDAPETGDAVQVDFVNEHELVVWPNGSGDDLQILFNGGPAEGRSWKFKHR